MIANKEKYRIVKDYIDDAGKPESVAVQKLRNETGYNTLFRLIDVCLEKSSQEFRQNTETGYQQPKDMNALFSDLCAGINDRNSTSFLKALRCGPANIERFLQIMLLSDIDDAMLANISMKSDRELAHMVATYTNHNKKPATGRVREKLAGYFGHVLPGKRTRLVLGTLVLLLMVSLPLVMQQQHHPLYKKYFEKMALPCDYNGSAFRGSLSSGLPAVNHEVRTQFNMAMGDYLMQNYQAALAQLAAITPDAKQIEMSSQYTHEDMQLYRDIWFYSGICKMALAGEHKQNLLQSAVTDFMKAEKLVHTNQLKGGSREYFFMAMAQDLLGNKPAALAYLGRINESSIYYQDSQNRIRQLNN